MTPVTVSWVSLAVALLALGSSVYTWWVTHNRRKYEIADSILTDLLKIALEHPELRDPEYIKAALHHEDKTIRYRYDAYATLVWNYIETLFDIYGERLTDSSFYGALKGLGSRHKAWFFDNDRYQDYNKALPSFLKVSG
jgi:hypothetical protein